jgi:uncharacterized protein (TIGR00369 family)
MAAPPEILNMLAAGMNQGSPQAYALGIETLEIGDATALLRIPYKPEMVGDPSTGVIAGGVVTTLLDHTCGQAVMAALKEGSPIATLDLRIDYMRAAEPGKALYARAHCYKLGHQIAFVRAAAYEVSEDNPVATAQAAFMLNASSGRPLASKARQA